MQQYEIRILRDDNNPWVVAGKFLGDFHAIRRAHAMAEEDEGLEVWRGMTCVYRRETLPRHLRSPSWLRRPSQETEGLRP